MKPAFTLCVKPETSLQVFVPNKDRRYYLNNLRNYYTMIIKSPILLNLKTLTAVCLPLPSNNVSVNTTRRDTPTTINHTLLEFHLFGEPGYLTYISFKM